MHYPLHGGDAGTGLPPPVSRPRTESLVRLAAVLLDVLVAAVLVGEAAQEGLARHGPCNVSDPVFALLG